MSYIQRFFNKNPESLTQEDILLFINQKIEESSILEYKSSSYSEQVDKIARGICGFANADGGLLVIGIKEAKTTQGRNTRLPDSIDYIPLSFDPEKLENQLSSKIKPYIDFKISLILNNQGAILLFDIPQGQRKPYWCNMGFFRRRNYKTEPMDYAEIKTQFQYSMISREKIIDNLINPMISFFYDLLNKNSSKGWSVDPNITELENLIKTQGHYYYYLDFGLIESIDDFIDLVKKRKIEHRKALDLYYNIIFRRFSILAFSTINTQLPKNRPVQVICTYKDQLQESVTKQINLFQVFMKGTYPEDYAKTMYKSKLESIFYEYSLSPDKLLVLNIERETMKLEQVDNNIPRDLFNKTWKTCLDDRDNDPSLDFLIKTSDEVISEAEYILSKIEELR